MQLLNQALWWSEKRSAEQAFKWLTSFEKTLQALSQNPQRHRQARENAEFDRDLREIYYGLGKRFTHRAVFEIRENEVVVYSIRHLAQTDLTPDDL